MIDRWDMEASWGEPLEAEDPPSTHDEGDQWESEARSGRERCGGCGMEWSVGDEPGCVCYMAFEEEEGEEEEE